MLKIWKTTWREKEKSMVNSHSEQVRGQEGTLEGPSNNASSNVAEAIPPSDSVPVPVLPSVFSRQKRYLECAPEISEHSPHQPLKKPKTSQHSDVLGNHLPENFKADEDVYGRSVPMASLVHEVLEQAKLDNTIAFLPPSTTVDILAQFLDWAIEMERAGPNVTIIRPRIAVLVVDNELSVDKYATQLESALHRINMGKYTDHNHRSGTNSWNNMLQKDVIVIPVPLLLDLLSRGTMAITHLHTMIILDAQVIKDQDSHALPPIVQIMNDFYRVTDPLFRPRIFAPAVPSAGQRIQLDSGTLKLESILDAKVFGVSAEKRSEIFALPDHPQELVLLFDAPAHMAETALVKQLRLLDPSETVYSQYFDASHHALNDVGACASDLVWRRALKEIEADVPQWYDDENDDEDATAISLTNTKFRIRDIVKNWPFTLPNLDMSSRGFNVTPKFLRLVHILQSCESYGVAFRGIVFVHRRLTALAIADLLRTLDDRLRFLRPCVVIGHELSGSLHLQEIFRSFATGTYNFLIATKALEDLDVPRASMVICFDLFESQISHAYIRACTRGRESHLVYMAERGNDVHRRILSQKMHLNDEMLRWTEHLYGSPQSSVPPCTLMEGSNPYHADDYDEKQSDTYIKDPVTSSRIYLHDATTVLYRFASRLGLDNKQYSSSPLFEFRDVPRELGMPRLYVCAILLPGTLINNVLGSPSLSMAHARRSACYNACVKLLKAGRLDYRLFPLQRKIVGQAPDKGAAPSAYVSGIKHTGIKCYPRKQPDFWLNATSAENSTLYPVIISTSYSDETMRPHAPMLILTRQSLPDLTDFKIFFSGVPAVIHLQRGVAFHLDDTRLHDLYMYTIRICRAISNKPLVCAMANMPYFLAPLTLKSAYINEPDQGDLPHVSEHIPWDAVTRAGAHWAVSLLVGDLSKMTKEIEDAVIQDRSAEFTRRYDVVKMRPDLNPLSKPLDSPREADYTSLLDFFQSRRKKFEGLQDMGQPIIEVSKLPQVLNRLNPTSRPLTASPKSEGKYLIPELCAKFTIPASTLRTALFLPSITRRIDDFLLVKELNAKLFNHVISEDLLLVAISAPSAGIEYDYERLELLGDSFLKYLASIYVFVTNPTDNEGALHVGRQRIISNKSLMENATRAGLPPFIQAKPFSVKLWQPLNFQLVQHLKDDEDIDPSWLRPKFATNIEKPQEDANDDVTIASTTLSPFKLSAATLTSPKIRASTVDEGQETPTDVQNPKKKSKKKKQYDEAQIQWLGDKMIADVAEAIIGAAYISGGRDTALKVTKALNIPVPNIDRWSDLGRKVLTPSPNITAKLRPGSIEAVEAIIGHKFHHKHLLAQALTHSSAQGFESTSYERLEFIGDAVLEFMVIRHIFDRDQQLSPGGLTLLKGAMVSNSALAAVCVWAGLHKHILLESYHLASSIQQYVHRLNVTQTEEYETAEREGRSPGQYWADIEPPKALSDVVESVIGAIYISDNFSPIGAETLFDNLLKPFYDKHITLKTLSHHPTKSLFELFQAQGCQQFEIFKEKDANLTRCHVIVHNVILSSAEDATAAFAARHASLFALDALNGDAEFLTRTCDCRTRSQTKKGQKKALEHILSGFEEDEEDILAVEKVLRVVEHPGDGATSEIEEGMIIE